MTIASARRFAPSIVGALAIVLFSWEGLAWWRGPVVTQPIQFPHKTHVEMNMECTTCHDRAEKDAVAGRPPTELCLSCHAAGDGKGELQKLQAYADGGDIPWRRVWRLPRHVYFSHRRHVAIAKVKCQTCHGPMETLTRPPARPLRTLAMKDCLECHEQWKVRVANAATSDAHFTVRSVSTECTSCHR